MVLTMKRLFFCSVFCAFGCTTTTIVTSNSISAERFILTGSTHETVEPPTKPSIITPEPAHSSEVKRVIVKKGCDSFHTPVFGPEPHLPINIKEVMVKNPSRGLEILAAHIHDQSTYIADMKAKISVGVKVQQKSCK